MVRTHLTFDGANDGATNMQRDEACLRQAEAGLPSARIYGWTGAWITVGKNERVEKDLVLPSEIPWVRRPTGGKAVLHGHDITVGLAMPLEHAPMPKTLRAVYPWVMAPIAEALRGCGLAVAFGSERGGEGGDCFAYATGVDLIDPEGIKVCGAALLMTKDAVLVQASIPVRSPLVSPESVIRGGGDRRTACEWTDGDFPRQFAQAWTAFVESNQLPFPSHS